MTNWRFGLDGTVFAYTDEIWRNAGFVALLGIPILWKPWAGAGQRRLLPYLLVAGACISVAVCQFIVRPGIWPARFPTPFQTAVNFGSVFSNQPEAPLEALNYDRPFGPQVEKVVVVMDESIRGDYVSLNDEALGTTPYLASIKDAIANFGVASSAANCSVASRQSFRHILKNGDSAAPLAPLLAQPTIWQYAKAAGYRTVHFDAFGSPITLTSGMSAAERAFVDERRAIMDVPFPGRDMRIAAELRTLLKQPGRMFIYVEKFGSHVPYTSVYPAEDNVFGADLSKPFDLTDRVELVKYYKNAVHWTVDRFFAELLKDGVPASTILFYTSDHGQSLSEGGIKLSHCSTVQPMRWGEAAVPLFALSSDQSWLNRLRTAATANRNRASHANLAPTVLTALGVDPDWLQQHFDPPLTDTIPDGRKRLVRFGGTAVEYLPPAP